MTNLREFFQIPVNADEADLFRKMIRVSLAIHAAVFLFFGLKASFFASEPIELDPTIRVDMVGLPDKIAKLPDLTKPKESAIPKEAPKPEPKPIPKVEKVTPKAAPHPEVVLHPKHDTSKALEKIRELEKQERRKRALEDIQNQIRADEQRAERQAKVAQILKGNAVNAGTALHGLLKSEFNDFAKDVHAHIHEHWALPEWLHNDSLSAVVVVFLDTNGKVTKRILRKPSGDSRFDDYVLKAVDEASPFPKPPEKFVNLVKEDGIALGFPQ